MRLHPPLQASAAPEIGDGGTKSSSASSIQGAQRTATGEVMGDELSGAAGLSLRERLMILTMVYLPLSSSDLCGPRCHCVGGSARAGGSASSRPRTLHAGIGSGGARSGARSRERFGGMVEHVAAMMSDLLDRAAFPPRLDPRQPSPANWQAAARNARTLLSTYTTCFRARKSTAAPEEEQRSSAERGADAKNEKPPPDCFEYGQGAAAYIVSNGMSLSKVRWLGVPTAIAGVRSHLERRAQKWVESAFGRERASDVQFLADAHRSKVSVLTGVVSGDGADAAESVIVRLLGGSTPNEMADSR
ncbi:MAG: hypothetical protein SGPRY_012892 [Prymnesium sp.]